MTAASYVEEHADALAVIRAAGADITFTLTATSRNPTTNIAGAPVTYVVSGAAIRTRDNPITFQALELVATEAATLLFAPDANGALPPLGASCVWGGQGYVVRNVQPIAPSGVAIMARVIVSR